MLCVLVKEVINKYKIVPEADGWGWKESPVQSWNEFLTTNVVEAHKNIRPYISEEEYRKVLKLANRDAGINQPFYYMVILDFIILYFKEICYMV